MRTAQEIYFEALKNLRSYDEPILVAINNARKEAIKECAKVAKFTRHEANKRIILSLINELK